MPYHLPKDAGPGTTGVQLQINTPRVFELKTPFLYAPEHPLPDRLSEALPDPPGNPPDTGHRWLAIDAGETDLGSVPGILWGLIASYGRHTLAVIVHDRLTGKVVTAPRQQQFIKRCAADEVFFEALRDSTANRYQAPWFRSLIMWAGVSLDRYRQYRRWGLWLLLSGMVGAWTFGLWVAQTLPGPRLPVASTVLLVVAVVLLVAAGVFATELRRLRPDGVGTSPTQPRSKPNPLLAATLFLPVKDETVGRTSDLWVVRAMVAGCALLLLAACWTSLPWPALFGVVVIPTPVGLLGLAVLVVASVVLMFSPVRRDALLPLIAALAIPSVGSVALVTFAVLYLLWIPDAFSSVGDGPINTVDVNGGDGDASSGPEGSGQSTR